MTPQAGLILNEGGNLTCAQVQFACHCKAEAELVRQCWGEKRGLFQSPAIWEMGGLFSKKFHPPSLREGLSFYRDGEAQGKEARGREVSKPSFLGWREGSLLLGRSIGQGDGVLIHKVPAHLSHTSLFLQTGIGCRHMWACSWCLHPFLPRPALF